MGDNLTIVDLDYLHQPDSKAVTGGYVSTTAFTSAGYGSALAYGSASAYGQGTYTDTNAITSIQNYSSATRSYARATSTATNGIREKSFSKSTSIYYFGS